MVKLPFQIWAVANLLVLLVLSVFLFPHRLGLGISALLYSCLFSLPAVVLLHVLLRLIRFARGGIVFSWIVLLTGTALVALLAYFLFQLAMHEPAEDADFVLLLSLVSGYSAILAFSSRLHYLFQTFQYGSDENH